MGLVSLFKRPWRDPLNVCYTELIVRNLPHVDQEVGPHQTPNMPAPSPQTSQPPGGAKFVFCCVKGPCLLYDQLRRPWLLKETGQSQMSFLLLPISNVVLFWFALGRDSASLQVVCFNPGRSLRLSVPERAATPWACRCAAFKAPIFAPAYQVLISVLFPGPLSLLHPSHSFQLSPTQDPFCLFCTSLRAYFHSQPPSLCLQA